MKFHTTQHFDWICTFSVCFLQYLTCSPDPLRTIYATLKHLLSSQLLGLMFQTALRRFHMHSSQFQKKFKVNYLLQIMTIHFAMRDTNTHTHTHTHIHAFKDMGSMPYCQNRQHCRLGSAGSAKVNIQSSITTVSGSTHTCKTFKNLKMFECSNYQ